MAFALQPLARTFFAGLPWVLRVECWWLNVSSFCLLPASFVSGPLRLDCPSGVWWPTAKSPYASTFLILGPDQARRSPTDLALQRSAAACRAEALARADVGSTGPAAAATLATGPFDLAESFVIWWLYAGGRTQVPSSFKFRFAMASWDAPACAFVLMHRPR